jgi:metal-responsive CopG/Arc/MetJ family transcriptional regulator
MDEERAVRFTVSLPARLMRTLDRLAAGRRYSNRSEFVRDLLRGELVKEEWAALPGETVGVADPRLRPRDATRSRISYTDIQHHGFRSITASLHVHLDEHSVPRGHCAAWLVTAHSGDRESAALGQRRTVWAARPGYSW